MNTAINLVACFVSAVISTFTLFVFFRSFGISKYKKSTNVILLSVIGVLFTVFLFFTSPGLIRTLVLLSITIFISYLVELKWFNHILLSALIFAISSVAEIAVASIINLMFSIDLSQITTSIIHSVVGMLISKVLILVVVVLIRAGKHKLLSGAKLHQTIILLFIPVSTIGIILLQFSYFIRITTQTQSMLFAAIVCYSLLILANIVVFYYIDNMEEMVAKDLTISTASKLIDMQTEQYQTIIDNQNQTFKLQHDYKNFLLGIINDINNNNYNEALADLDSQYQLFSKGSSPDSGINIIHTVINNKRKAAEQSGITIDFEYHNLSKIVISSVDIAILLGNAIDNAIEATQKVTDLQNKKITVFAQLKNNTIVLKISNPVNEQIDTNNLRSTKKEKAYHGYGIASMNNIVKKHKGSLVFACSNLMFETVITLNNSAIVNECAEKDNERAV